jgi:DNA-binding NarL/FixJ family response regulator
VRVVVADDQTVVREGLVTLLGTMPGIEVVGSAADGEEAVSLVAELAPEVVLMDLRMPRVGGVEATKRIRAEHPETQVVVLTTYADDESIVGALRAGAIGYITKDAGRTTLAALSKPQPRAKPSSTRLSRPDLWMLPRCQEREASKDPCPTA